MERQRMEERAAHENTMGMVAAEVSRLKFGQAELVKAHRQYQVLPLPPSCSAEHLVLGTKPFDRVSLRPHQKESKPFRQA